MQTNTAQAQNSDYESDAVRAEQMRAKMDQFVGKLKDEAKRRVDRRKHVENRWLDDLRQYHGIYSDDMVKRLKEIEGSSVFLNVTRPKTNAMQARLWDLLFPTDDSNWGIGPTPVPELVENSENVVALAGEAQSAFDERETELKRAEAQDKPEQADKMAAEMEEAENIRSAAQRAADELQEKVQAGARSAGLMRQEIEDQLKACSYQAECRDMIEDACKIGTGVLKGPVLGETSIKRWTGRKDEQGNVHYILADDPNDTRPAAYRVDPWSFFPDPDASKVEDCEGFFERHMMNAKQFKRFVQQSDVDEDAARRVIKAGPNKGDQPSFQQELSNISGKGTGDTKDLFIIWEYTGPVEYEDMEFLAEAFDDPELIEDLLDNEGDIDPLIEWQAKVWFCGDEILKYALHPLDSNEAIYSVYNLEKDEGTLFGFGIPYLMRDDQSIINAAQRMMMDDGGLSTGPQVVVDKEAVVPANGDYTLTPRKMWYRNKSKINSNDRPFETFEINSNQAELANILNMARQNVDESTSMPQIAQGEQGTGVTKTAQGMALLMNSANVVFRRVVKNFDDDVTVPMIRRFYHWNMQFSKKGEIKGDYDVDARGSSVLLVREMMGQNMIMIANMFGDHPIYGKWLKHVDLLKQIFRAHMIPMDEITKTQTEVDAEERRERETSQQDPVAMLELKKLEVSEKELEFKQVELQAKVETANMESATKRYVADRNFEAAMHKIAEALNMKVEELATKAGIEQAKTESSERRLAVEVADKRATGVGAGGSV